MRIILDTGVIRSIIHGDEPVIDIKRLQSLQPAVVTSIAEPAFAEIIAAIHEKRVSWDAWRNTVSTLDRILDPSMPVLPGRKELAEYVSGNLPACHLEYIQAGWRHIVESKNIESLNSKSSYLCPDGTEKFFTANFEAAQTIREVVHHEWVGIVETMQGLLKGKGFSEPAIESIIRKGYVGIPGQPLDCIDAAVRYLIRTINLAVNGGKTPYNPLSNSNDAFDHELLYALAIPDSVLCTTDERLISIVALTGSLQLNRVINISQLNKRLEEGTLRELFLTSCT